MAVDVRLRSNPSVAIEAYIDRVGPQFELVPPHQLRDPRVAEWGLPVRVVLATQGELRPGELVDLRFRPGKQAQMPARENLPAAKSNPEA